MPALEDPDILTGPCGAPLCDVGRPTTVSPTMSDEEDDDDLELPADEAPAVGDFEDFDENDFDDEFDEDFEGELGDEYELSEFETATPAEIDDSDDDDEELPMDGDFVDEDAEEEPAEPAEAEKAPEEEEPKKKGKKKK